jgi:hypothetical protein
VEKQNLVLDLVSFLVSKLESIQVGCSIKAVSMQHQCSINAASMQHFVFFGTSSSVPGSGFRVWGLGLRFNGLCFRV